MSVARAQVIGVVFAFARRRPRVVVGSATAKGTPCLMPLASIVLLEHQSEELSFFVFRSVTCFCLLSCPRKSISPMSGDMAPATAVAVQA